MVGYLILRAMLWVGGVFVALFPTLFSVGIANFSFLPHDLAVAVNRVGEFHDLVFVIVVVSVLGLSVILEFLFLRADKANHVIRKIAIYLLLGNIIALASGLVCFLGIPAHSPIQDLRWMDVNYMLVGGALAMGAVTEVIVSSANHYYG